MSDTEKFTTEFKDGDGIDVATMGSFMDISTLAGKLYIQVPIIFDITARPTELIEDVIVTMRAKKILSANDYDSETFGY